jgi:hypothetical protein
MIGMEMGVDRLDQPKIQLLEELDVTIHPLEHRVDDERFSAMAACEQIGIGARSAVE